MPLIFLILLLATPASAQVQHAVPRNGEYVLPPEEYDRPYTGALVTSRAKDQDEVRLLCRRPFMYPAVACAFPTQDHSGCWIIMAPDKDIKAAGWDPEIVRRHEIGHCLGWPKDHKGARLAPRNSRGYFRDYRPPAILLP